MKRKILSDISNNMKCEKKCKFNSPSKIDLTTNDENEVSNLTMPSPVVNMNSCVSPGASSGALFAFDVSNEAKITSKTSARTVPQLSMPLSLWHHEIAIDSLGNDVDVVLPMDLFYAKDPDFVTDTVVDMYKHFKQQEIVAKVDHNYLRRQKNFHVGGREILVNAIVSALNWLTCHPLISLVFQLNICRKMELLQSTLFLAIHIMDSYFSRVTLTFDQSDANYCFKIIGFTATMVR